MKHFFLVPVFAFLFSLSCSFAQLPPSCGGMPDEVPPAESCAEVCIYCNFNGYMGNTAGYTGNGIPNGGYCSMIQNDQWLGFVAGAASAAFNVVPSNCSNGDGVQVALYESCNTAPLACNPGCAGCGNTTTTITTTMVIGTNYFLLIDGLSGDECDISINVVPASAVKAPEVGTMGPISGPSTVCPGGAVKYQVASVVGAGAYTWACSTPGVKFNGQFSPATFDAPDGRIVEVTFPTNVSIAQICVSAANSCASSTQEQCRFVSVKPIPLTVLPPVTITPSQLPYTLPWGDIISQAGDYQTTLSTVQGCDSIVKLTVLICPAKITNLPVQTICGDSCLTVCGTTYCTSGTYSKNCPLSGGCDSIINFTLKVIGTPKVLPGSKLALTCKDSVLNLTATASGSLGWYDQKDKLLSNTNQLKVDFPGIYTVKNFNPDGKVCGSQSVTVKRNMQLPNITAKGGTITPGQPSVTLKATSTTSGVKYLWTGPNGFTSQKQNPVVSIPGMYTVTVTDPANGCRNSASVEVSIE